jgi:cytochrome c-type biogenesis protein CcmE
VIALSVAVVLAIFLLYTSLAAQETPSLQPSQLPGHHGRVTLGGMVVGPVAGDAHNTPLRFVLRDNKGSASVPVSYRGTVPDLFKVGRDVSLDGQLVHGTFVAFPNTLVTKCPSKYTAKKF